MCSRRLLQRPKALREQALRRAVASLEVPGSSRRDKRGTRQLVQDAIQQQKMTDRLQPHAVAGLVVVDFGTLTAPLIYQIDSIVGR